MERALAHPSAKIDKPASPTTANGAKENEGVVPIPSLAALEPHHVAVELMAKLAADDEG